MASNKQNVSSTVESGASAPTPPAKNSCEMKTDPTWKYCVLLDPISRRVKCKFCEGEVIGGVYHLQHHLAGTRNNVKPYLAVPDDVKSKILDKIYKLQTKLLQKSQEISIEGGSVVANDDLEVVGCSSGKRKSQMEITPKDMFKRGITSTLKQTTINGNYKQNLRDEACKDIAFFFYNNSIPFNVARSEEFQKMFESAIKHGIGFKPPSYHEIRVKYLDYYYGQISKDLEGHRAVWRKLGCTIMRVGWTDRRRRTILNFLMINDIVEEVGEENVIQVVTDNAANYKVAGELLMEKRNTLYWTPCVAHCIDLMLRYFEKKISLHKDTISRDKKITT
ncbi:uncharacterized protein LOC127104174 [Lathyrus oleraceus]|uniref:uncharacterized protein LOC127104174 n=1 Tax=Pisum sativum TaxID=3888 RepID=UPI0021D3C33B|nr:uncharacterized protein LOC127104174 [Pisum sativum]